METEGLRKIGLTDSEIKVYFALLQTETSKVGPLIEKARVPDSKIYSILEKLKEKGLASFVIKNNVRHFSASGPENLVKIIEEKESSLEALKKELTEKIIPQIEERQRLTEDKQEATVYEAFDGVRAAFNLILDTLERGDEYQVFMLGDALKEKRVIRLFENYHKRRIEKGIRVRLLSERSFVRVINKFHRYKGMKIRFTNMKLPVGTFIFRNHVMTVVWGEKPSAFVIKSARNYNYYKEFFDYMWNKAA